MKSSNSDHPDRANIRWSEAWNTLPEAFIPSLAAPSRCRTTHTCVDRHTWLYIVSIDTLGYRSTQYPSHVSIDTTCVSIDTWYNGGVPKVRHVSIDTSCVSFDTSTRGTIPRVVFEPIRSVRIPTLEAGRAHVVYTPDINLLTSYHQQNSSI